MNKVEKLHEYFDGMTGLHGNFWDMENKQTYYYAPKHHLLEICSSETDIRVTINRYKKQHPETKIIPFNGGYFVAV